MTDFIAAAPYRSGAHFEQGWSVVSDHFGIVAYGVTQEAAEWVANRLNDMAARFAGDGHGPGSRRDKDKALLQLEACFSAYPMATGYSHLTALILRDTNEGLRATAEAGGAPTPATRGAPLRTRITDLIGRYVDACEKMSASDIGPGTYRAADDIWKEIEDALDAAFCATPTLRAPEVTDADVEQALHTLEGAYGDKVDWDAIRNDPDYEPTVKGIRAMLEQFAAKGSTTPADGMTETTGRGVPTAYERAGMDWWNALPETERATWIARAGFAASPADAYALFKQSMGAASGQGAKE